MDVTGRIDYFPSPLPDESLFSRLARYHLLSGHLRSRFTLHELFARNSIVITSHLPSGIGQLAERIAGKRDDRLADSLLSHTMFPYFLPFLSQRQATGATQALVGRDAGSVKGLLGVLASRVGGHNRFRLCDACISEDRLHFGYAYWHRAHQLPGVWICHKHSLPLQSIQLSWSKRVRHELFLPDSDRLIPYTDAISIAPAQFRLLNSIAKRSYELMQTRAAALGTAYFVRNYREKAMDLGLITLNGRVRVEPFERYFSEALSSLFGVEDFQKIIYQARSPPWALNLLRKPRSSMHPLKHILMMSVLSLDWCDMRVRPFICQSRFRSLAESEKETKEAGKASVDHELTNLVRDKGCSLRSCAKLLGKSVTTLKIQAVQLDLSVKLRPKKIKEDLFSEVVELLQSGHSVAEVAEYASLSIVSVYRILKMQPKVFESWRQMRFERELVSRRGEAANAAFEGRPVPKSVYAWLYRNDRDWLKKMLEGGKSRLTSRSPLVDWDARDRKLSEAVIFYCKSACDPTLKAKPIRLTRSLIARQLCVEGLLDHHLHRLPNTQRVLAERVETVEQFQLRRVSWVVRCLSDENIPVRAWIIIRRAGLKQPLSQAVCDLIRSLAP